jgi:glyoxalase/bleomycin resistance protein/dioxygenase superfamily protein
MWLRRDILSNVLRTAVDLFVGIPVRDLTAARPWFERLLGSAPSFLPNDTEAVWELAEHRFVYIVQDPDRAGHGLITVFVDDLDTVVTDIASRDLEPAGRETYPNGVRKITYRDPDGNSISFGGAPPG